MDPLSKLGIGVSGIVALGVLVYVGFRSWVRGREKIGAAKERERQKDAAIDAVAKAKEATDAVQPGGDPEFRRKVEDATFRD